MALDEGYIKYDSRWTPGPAPDSRLTDELDRWRRPLFDAGLIGEYAAEQIGFGNLSMRSTRPGQFVISGTQTGRYRDTRDEHYALVTAYDIDANRVDCTGPLKASSEAMTHAAIYELDAGIGAVVHVHNMSAWQRYCGVIPTTDAAIGYGTPDMAREFSRLFDETPFAQDGVAAMGGHEEGLISFGATLEQATLRILRLLAEAEQK